MKLNTFAAVVAWAKANGMELWVNAQTECQDNSHREWHRGRAIQPDQLEHWMISIQDELSSDRCDMWVGREEDEIRQCGSCRNVITWAVGVSKHPASGQVELARLEWSQPIGSVDVPGNRLVPNPSVWVSSPLRRGDMEVDEWQALVEGEASKLAFELSQQLDISLTAEVHWHGHAEILIVPVDTRTVKVLGADEEDEEYEVRTDAVMRVWVP